MNIRWNSRMISYATDALLAVAGHGRRDMWLPSIRMRARIAA